MSIVRLLWVVTWCFCILSMEVGAQTIGLRFVVDQSLGGTGSDRLQITRKLEQYVTELNGYYSFSKVTLRAEVVEVAFSPISAIDAIEALGDMAREWRGFAGLFQRADEIGADYTIAMVPNLMLRGKPSCGRAFAVNQTAAALSSTRAALLVMRMECGPLTLAHELGHLMGLNHGHLVAQCTGETTHRSAIAPYANGWGVGNCDGVAQLGEFGSIMVGGWMRQVNGQNRSLPLFSNPRLEDIRCGVSMRCGDSDFGDEARALNEYAALYAAHEEPDVHTLVFVDPQLAACIANKYKHVEILELQELACPNAGIKDLQGIERLIALRRIDLSGNKLTHIASLLQFPGHSLEWVNLSGNSSIDNESLLALAQRFRLTLLGTSLYVQ